MFYHMDLAAKESHEYAGNTYEIVVYRAKEDGHLCGYISLGGFGAWIVEMSGEVASDMRVVSGGDPVETIVSVMKDEIAGKF